jgi:hypothetical protein
LEITERLVIMETALHLVREDIEQMEQPLARVERKRQLAAAAEALLPYYVSDTELTVFTALDSEDFHLPTYQSTNVPTYQPPTLVR